MILHFDQKLFHSAKSAIVGPFMKKDKTMDPINMCKKRIFSPFVEYEWVFTGTKEVVRNSNNPGKPLPPSSAVQCKFSSRNSCSIAKQTLVFKFNNSKTCLKALQVILLLHIECWFYSTVQKHSCKVELMPRALTVLHHNCKKSMPLHFQHTFIS